jgi:hypothetical protein
MYIPLVRERVCVRGSSGTFVVVHVDYHRELAELEPDTAEKNQIVHVPFEKIFAIWEFTEAARSDCAAD